MTARARRQKATVELFLMDKTLKFATLAHEGQQRKYTFEPYIVHPQEVAAIVATVPHTIEMYCAALMHDVLEDTDVTEEHMRREFGDKITDLVVGLTNVSKPQDGNRAYRKNLDLLALEKQPADVQTIKLADLIANTGSIVEHDPDFALIYLEEKRLLLSVLVRGDKELMKQAKALIGE